MDHQIALNTQAVERYTLDELTSPEREEFEEHFFTCADCAAALREHEAFAANARAVFKEDQLAATHSNRTPQPESKSWAQRIKGWFGMRTLIPAFAALVLAFVLFRPPDPAGPTYAWTLPADVRDEVPHQKVAPSTVWLAPTIDLVTGSHPDRWSVYHWEIRKTEGEIRNGDGGKIVAQGDGRQGIGHLTLKVPASKFDSGKEYRLIVQGDPATLPIGASFVIDRQ
ncbi:MAG TPA: zf-HC2 domain-containing protein [Bryobacteraceae bacterium]|jgi:hypothetical protein